MILNYKNGYIIKCVAQNNNVIIQIENKSTIAVPQDKFYYFALKYNAVYEYMNTMFVFKNCHDAIECYSQIIDDKFIMENKYIVMKQVDFIREKNDYDYMIIGFQNKKMTVEHFTVLKLIPEHIKNKYCKNFEGCFKNLPDAQAVCDYLNSTLVLNKLTEVI